MRIECRVVQLAHRKTVGDNGRPQRVAVWQDMSCTQGLKSRQTGVGDAKAPPYFPRRYTMATSVLSSPPMFTVSP
jgi:hypothetical protein